MQGLHSARSVTGFAYLEEGHSFRLLRQNRRYRLGL